MFRAQTLFSMILAAASLAIAGPALAQSSQPATGSMQIYSGLNVSTVRPLRVQIDPDGSALGLSAIDLADGPTLIEVHGDAYRVYRIEVVGGAREVSLEIWSVNAGDISKTRIGVMDADGQDLLRISGDPDALQILLDAGARIPLSIQYE
jgi:hypothetical protein